MEYKITIESLDKMLNGLIESDGKLTEQQMSEIQQVERYRTELKTRVHKLKNKLAAIRELASKWWADRRKSEFTKNELVFTIKTYIRMAYCNAMPYPASEFKDRFYESLGVWAEYYTATEEQLIKAQTLEFGEHYKYLYTFIKKEA